MKNLFILIVLLNISIVGCQSSPESAASIAATPTPNVPTVSPTATPSFLPLSPAPNSKLAPPVLIEIPAIRLLQTVLPMEWEVVDEGGQRTTVWKVPAESAGWHINSANAGAEGNVILSGHQEQGSAVFRQIALGSVQVGQEINLTSENGTIYVYHVIEVSEAIPLDGATAEQLEAVEQYYSQGLQPLLTLITGWPDFTTTHRVFVVAELVGQRT